MSKIIGIGEKEAIGFCRFKNKIPLVLRFVNKARRLLYHYFLDMKI